MSRALVTMITPNCGSTAPNGVGHYTYFRRNSKYFSKIWWWIQRRVIFKKLTGRRPGHPLGRPNLQLSRGGPPPGGHGGRCDDGLGNPNDMNVIDTL
jgi:hypothetical protein